MSFLVWFLPIIAGMADASQRGVIKLTRIHKFPLLAGSFFMALPWYTLWLYLEYPENIDPAFWFVIVKQTPLLVLANILIVEAHRASPLIVTAPYMALTPAFLLVTSPVMQGGSPTVLGGIGVLIISLGVFVLNTRDGDVSLLAPFSTLLKERGAVMMFGVAIIFSITANYDYHGVITANEPFFLLIAHGSLALSFTFLSMIYQFTGRLKSEELFPRGSTKPIILFGIFIAAAVIPHMLAFRWIPNVPYVIVGKRTGFMIWAVLMAMYLATAKKHAEKHAEERKHLRYRLPGTAVIMLGMIIIILYGQES